MATSGNDLSARVDELMTGAWVLAAPASAVSGRALTEEHGSVLGAAGYAERTSEGWRLRPAHRAAVEAGPALEAVLRWRMARGNVIPWSAAELAERLAGAGYRSVKEIETTQRTMAIVLARA